MGYSLGHDNLLTMIALVEKTGSWIFFSVGTRSILPLFFENLFYLIGIYSLAAFESQQQMNGSG